MAEGVEGYRGGGGGGGEEADMKLEFTPTWIVAGVCSLIILVSLSAERYLHHLGMVPPFASFSLTQFVWLSPGYALLILWNFSGPQTQEPEAIIQCAPEG